MLKTRYLFRIDDICPEVDSKKFNRLISLFDKYNIKPTLAIIPYNLDNSITSKNFYNKKSFTKLIKNLIKKRYIIGLHGYNHQLNKNYSEFKKVSLRSQRLMIKNGKKEIKRRYGIDIDIFISPVHSFDKNTLRVLKEEAFNVNYDGNAINPYFKNGLINIPCNLHLKIMYFPWGANTICVHPNKLTEEDFEKLEKFIINNRNKIIDLNSLRRMAKVNSSREFFDFLGILFLIPRMINYIKFRLISGSH